eukprot:gene10418-biopygen125
MWGRNHGNLCAVSLCAPTDLNCQATDVSAQPRASVFSLASPKAFVPVRIRRTLPVLTGWRVAVHPREQAVSAKEERVRKDERKLEKRQRKL